MNKRQKKKACCSLVVKLVMARKRGDLYPRLTRVEGKVFKNDKPRIVWMFHETLKELKRQYEAR